MEYIAHKDGDRIQTVLEHLTGTAQLAGAFADAFGKQEWGYCCGMLHDIGKYSEEFQKKIKYDTNEQVDHSTAGTKLCMEKGGYYSLLAYCIAGHHAGLPDYGNTEIPSSLCGRLKKKICDYQAYQYEVKIPKIETDPFVRKPNKNFDFSLSVFMRMIYSCLVDADFLDTEKFMKNGQTGRNSGQNMEILLEKLENHVQPWLENQDLNSINGRRTEILKACMEAGKEERGLFHLTVPTGGGKTIASLAFALRHAVFHHMDHIIYVIPYTSIIEQNAEVFRNILGEENVLEHHCNVDYDSSEDLKPMQLASENWDKPVIVTTSVQFFESLFANTSSKCRKLHNIANSVVIFDEAQMLPVDYLKPCIAMMETLMEDYRSSMVLCTATQPALDKIFIGERTFVELCPNVKEQFEFFRRVTYQDLGYVPIDQLAGQLQKEKQALCIVNTKKCAQELYRKLKGEGVYHLSTSMYQKHRKRILAQIRERLKQKKKCILISTSLVEAGVDLDFCHVYRQIAGVDSIIQAAGRCNREGQEKAEDSIVFVFDVTDSKIAPSQRLPVDIAKAILQETDDISDLDSITEYFKRLYRFREQSLDKKNIMGKFQEHKYNFETAAKKFRLIEEDTRTILVPVEQEAEELLAELKHQGFSKERMRKASQYCIQVYDNLFKILWDAGMIQEISSDATEFYELVKLDQYTEDMGLDLSVDSGMDLYL